ncbi:hypothetical protein MSAN_01046000 [Mycena sanguinolenta]|uniref:F-box domain-containing protein n=1 Tax=Mycena sanguinolenta TaxID=230812 RepID=A0A8H7D755_9AGAR|nr:hypothetical protein MSAN_01046000 [Mycena sanguinolenta]
MPLWSFAVGPLSNRPPQFQNQYSLVNEDGFLRLAAISRRVLALPPEILAEIFLFCLPYRGDDPVALNPKDAPLVLCAVCRQWRITALNTPYLWNGFLLLGPPRSHNFSTREAGSLYVDLCRMWLSSARSLPLSLSLRAFQPRKTFHSVLELVISRAHQWREIVLHGGYELSLPVDGKYPLLEKLTIFFLPPAHPTLSFRDAPRLRDVYMPSFTGRIQLPWHQIIKFRIGCDVEDCLEFLRHASNLVDAHLRVKPTYYSSYFDDLVLPNAILLPQLQFLDLSAQWRDGEVLPMALLQYLETPALQRLTLCFEDYDSTDSTCDISPFLSFVSQPSFKLHTLTLSRLPTTVDDLVDCLKAAPTVAQLELQISDHILNLNPLFAKLAGHGDFLPQLESFHISLSGASSIADPSLVLTALEWRCISTPFIRLQYFRFVVYIDDRNPELEDIDDCDIDAINDRKTEEYLKSFKSYALYPVLQVSGTSFSFGEYFLEWRAVHPK